MKKSHLILIGMLIIGISLAGCKPKTVTAPETLTPITINLTYIPNIQFAPLYVAIEQGYFAEVGLDVTLSYGNEADLVALVGSGNQTFTIASGEQVLLSRAQGLPVVYVMAWYANFPVGVASFAEKNIQSPQDLAGKTVGIPGLYGASYIGFEALRGVAGLGETDLALKSIGFTQVESLVARQVDAVVIYVANEPIVLKSLGYEVNLLRVADYLDLVANGLVTNEKTMREEPELVRDVVAALMKSILFVKSSPDETYEISKKYVENLADADEMVQKQILTASIALWQTERPGYSPLESWENMQALLIKIGLLGKPVNLAEAFTNDFID